MKKLFVLVSVAGVFLLAALAARPDRVVWEVSGAKQLGGPIEQGAVNASGGSYLGTRATLYRVANGKVRDIAGSPEAGARLALAPGAALYAWLVPRPDTPGLFLVRLVRISGEPLAVLEAKRFPHGFGQLFLGFDGELIVTVTPLDDAEGIDGRFQYIFWNRRGDELNALVLPGRLRGVLDPTGRAILFLGGRKAVARSPSGAELWRRDGWFKEAAISAGGKLALLNPATPEDGGKILLFRGSGRPEVVRAPESIRQLRLDPSGSLGVAVTETGRYFWLDVAKATLDEGKALPFDGPFSVSSAELLDAETLALGILHRKGEPPRHTWPRATVLGVDRRSGVSLRRDFEIREATSGIPAVHAIFGAPFFMAATREEAIFVSVE